MAKQSLAAQAGALSEQLKMPEVFSAPMTPVVSRFSAPYVVFAHNKRADEWAKLQSKFGVGGFEEHDMFLIGQEIHRLSPAKMSLITCRQYWAESNVAGTEILRASWSEMPKPFKEHIDAVVLVYLDDKVVPANIRVRTTKCPAVKALYDELVEASKPSWADRSPAHKETLFAPQPFMRYYGLVELGPTRTSRSTGLSYRTTVCRCSPTGVAEWKLIKEFTEREDAQKMLNDAANRFQERLNEIGAKVK